jgi:DNA-binding MarR family transcriptional regulator
MADDMPSEWLGGIPYRLWRANQALHRLVVGAIDDLGVTVTQLGITVHLDELGHMSASDLARLFRLTPQSTTTALNRLEALGWVQRVPHPIHKRVIWYEVTTLGLEKANEGRARVAAVNREVEALLGDIDGEALSRALSLISATYDEDLPAGTMWPVMERGAR